MASAISHFSNVSASVLTMKGVGSLTSDGGEGIGRIKGSYHQAQKNPIRQTPSLRANSWPLAAD